MSVSHAVVVPVDVSVLTGSVELAELVALLGKVVPDETTETTQVRSMLKGVDVEGVVVTADAAHTQRDTAQYLVSDKQADYVLAVKGNQPSLLAQVQALLPPAAPTERPQGTLVAWCGASGASRTKSTGFATSCSLRTTSTSTFALLAWVQWVQPGGGRGAVTWMLAE